MRKICVITSNRADYSRLKTLLKSLQKREDVELLLFVIGSHLLTEYGNTAKDIEEDGFNITYQMHTEVDGRIPVTMAKSTATAITELSSAFYNFKPDIVVIHGDRFEALAASISASFMNIPVAHIQGGEVTGTIDEHIRHAITKLSHLHFPSTEDAKERIVKLGEDPNCVHNLGCPSSDSILDIEKLTFLELKKEIFNFAKKENWKKNFDENFLLFVQHPVTTEFSSAEKNIVKTLEALKRFNNNILMLWPNIDAGSEKIVHEIKKFERSEDGRIGVFPNLPIDVFLNTIRHAKVMIGNSSAGIREACYFGTPVVNIGTRQSGRERGNNVIDVEHNPDEIQSAIEHQLKAKRYPPQYLYGEGKSGEKIAEVLATVDIGDTQKRINF